MGEAKQKREAYAKMTDYEKMLHDLTKKLANEGYLVRSGFQGFRKMVIPEDASEVQVKEMEKAFMAGAAHLLFGLMSSLDDGEEVTAAEERRMALIHKELDDFHNSLLMDFPHVGGKQ